MTFRAFIAADLPTTDRLESLVRELRTSGAPLKLVATEQLHTTLKFLGDTDEALVDRIADAIRSVTRGIAPVPVGLRGTGAFPSLSRMNVVWVGLEGAEPLGRIAAGLETALSSLGFRPEHRAWAPHVTLARVKGGRKLDRVRQILEAHASDAFGDRRVDAVRLKRSTLTPGGAVYDDVRVVPLEG